MGNQLSSPYVPDTSGVVLADWDKEAMIILAGLWGGVAYVLAMLWTTCTLIDRWRGPYDKHRTSGSSVLAALVLSAAWPAVLAYLLVSMS